MFSGKRLAGSVVGGAQILRDFPRFIRLAEAGLLDLGAMISQRIKLDEINDGIALLTHAEGTRTVSPLTPAAAANPAPAPARRLHPCRRRNSPHPSRAARPPRP